MSDGTLDTPVAARSSTSQLATLAVLGAAIVALYYGREILIPVALAALLAFALAPLVTRLRRAGLGRAGAVAAVVLLALVAVGGLGVVIVDRALQLAENLPTYQTNIQRKIQALRAGPEGGGVIDKASNALKELDAEIKKQSPDGPAAQSAAAAPPVPVRVEPVQPTSLHMLRDMAAPVLRPLGIAGLVIVFLVFLLLEREEIRDRFIRLVGGRAVDATTQALGEAAERVSRFLLMQLVVNATYGIPIGIGLYLIGVPNALLWGVIAGLLRFVPYVGPFVAALFPIALAIAVDPGWTMALATVALFLVVELVSNNIVEPWLYGPSTGLSAVAIILAAIFWTTLWGPLGLLLSTPLTVCLVVLGRHVPQVRFLYVLLGNAPALTPGERFYQRMLAGDTGEGEEIAAPYLAAGNLAGFHDEVVLPALLLAEADRRREALAPARVDAVAANVRLVLETLPDPSAGEERGSDDPPATTEWSRAPVLCVGGRTPLDVAAAELLAQRLERTGVPAQVVAADSFADGAPFDREGLMAVALVHLGPSAVAHSRQLARRLRKTSQLRIVAVLLNGQLPAPVRDEQVHALLADGVATSLEGAAHWLQELAGDPVADPMLAAPLPQDEAERLAELARLKVLDTPREDTYDRYTQRLREAFGTPVALVSLVDECRQWWKASSGLPETLERQREAPRETSICGHVVAADEMLVIEDVLRDKRFATNPFLRQHGIRFYAGAPLRTSKGLAIGSLCILDTKPRRVTRTERQLLELVADEVVREMEHRAKQETAQSPSPAVVGPA